MHKNQVADVLKQLAERTIEDTKDIEIVSLMAYARIKDECEIMFKFAEWLRNL